MRIRSSMLGLDREIVAGMVNMAMRPQNEGKGAYATWSFIRSPARWICLQACHQALPPSLFCLWLWKGPWVLEVWPSLLCSLVCLLAWPFLSPASPGFAALSTVPAVATSCFSGSSTNGTSPLCCYKDGRATSLATMVSLCGDGATCPLTYMCESIILARKLSKLPHTHCLVFTVRRHCLFLNVYCMSTGRKRAVLPRSLRVSLLIWVP